MKLSGGIWGRVCCATVLILDARQDENAIIGYQSAQAVNGQIDQGLAAEQLQEMLGLVLAAQRPESRSRAAGHDHGITVVAQHALSSIQG